MHVFAIFFITATIWEGLRVNGTVLDRSSREAIPGVVVRISGAKQAAVTAADGTFHLNNVRAGATMEFSHVGYKRTVYTLSASYGEEILEILMEEEAVKGADVVVRSVPFSQDRASTPVPVQVMDAAVLEQVSASSLLYGLSYQPGIRVENSCSNCGFTQVRLNGMEGSYTQLLLDGRPVVSSLQAVYGLEQFPVSMLEQVEVIRSGSAQYGGNAVAGTINIITRNPEEAFGEVLVEQGARSAAGDEFQAQLAWGGPLKDSRRQLQFFGYTRGRRPWNANPDASYTAERGTRTDDFSELTQLRQAVGHIRYQFKPTAGRRITAQSRYTHEFRRGGNAFSLRPHRADIAEQLVHNMVFADVLLEQALDGEHRFSAWLTGNGVFRDSYYGMFQDPNAYGTTRSLVGNGGFFVETTQGKANVRYGMDVINEQITDVFLGFDRRIEQQNRLAGAYVQMEHPFRDRDRLQAGLRADLHTALERPVLNPRLNYLMGLGEHVTIRSGFSTGFRPPVLFDEDLHIEAIGGQQKFIQNARGLRPERSSSWQFGVDIEDGDLFSARFFRMGLFSTRLAGNFVQEPVETDRDIFLVERRNGTGSRVQGATLEGGWRALGRWEIQAGWTLQQGRNRDPVAWSETQDPESRFLRIPGQYGYLLFTREMRKWSVSSDVNINGPMLLPHYAGYIESDRLVRTPWFMDAGIKTAAELFSNEGGMVRMELSIRNLFNRFQRDLDVGVNRDPGYVYGPLLPRTVFTTLRYTVR